MKKRTWAYIQKPQEYSVACDICGGDNLDWSEFEKCVWCYDCKKDIPGTAGIFDGPVGINACRLLGMSFDRYIIATGEVQTFEEYSKED